MMVLKVQRITWWKHPNLWKRLTIYQGIEKVLALYFVIWQEGKHCSNYSTWHFYKEIKHFSSQYFQSICVLNICFIVFSFLCAFIPDREFLPFSRSFAYFIWLHWILAVACGILVPWPGIKLLPCTVEVLSLNNWTTRVRTNMCAHNVFFFYKH